MKYLLSPPVDKNNPIQWADFLSISHPSKAAVFHSPFIIGTKRLVRYAPLIADIVDITRSHLSTRYSYLFEGV